MQNDKVKILFLHGLGQNKKSFDKTIENINFKDIENIDLIPNNSKDLTFFDIADRLENKIKGIKKPIIICGISLGAILAMELYFRNPEKIAGLILIAPQYKIPKILMNFQNLIFKIMPEKFFKKTKISKNNMISIASSIKNLDYSKKINKISTDVFIVCGKKDRANLKAAKSLNKLIPNSNLFLIQNSRHEVNIDAPEKLSEIINLFYKNFQKNTRN